MLRTQVYFTCATLKANARGYNARKYEQTKTESDVSTRAKVAGYEVLPWNEYAGIANKQYYVVKNRPNYSNFLECAFLKPDTFN